MLSTDDWNELFPERWGVGSKWCEEYCDTPFYTPGMQTDYYSYENFGKAVSWAHDLGHFDFLNEPYAAQSDNSRELCAFLANISYLTSNSRDSLYYRESLEHERYTGGPIDFFDDVGLKTTYKISYKPTYYSVGSHKAGDIKFPQQSYHARGPARLCGADRYGMFSEFVYGNPNKLLQNPDLILTNGALGFLSAIWLWMNQRGNRQSAHRSMFRHRKFGSPWGFGHTLVAMSDGECSDARKTGKTGKEVAVRQCIELYKYFADRFQVKIDKDGEQLDTEGLS